MAAGWLSPRSSPLSPRRRRFGSREEAPGSLDTPKKFLIRRRQRLEAGIVVRAECKLVRCGGDNGDNIGGQQLV
ncbi:unnamed protein product [Linum trigynum]|uniref:Uncharacterized protein n=1 Tax=Linum trigynum TaxID=586398 RepID=A0AAV2EBJ5_9ROSI